MSIALLKEIETDPVFSRQKIQIEVEKLPFQATR